MRIYVISLDHDHHRYSIVKERLEAEGLHPERISAVYGKDLSPDELSGWCPEAGHFYKLGPGEVGCYLSHRKFWQNVVDGDDDYAVVFEDDVVVGKQIADLLNRADWIPKDADVIKLETNFYRTIVSKQAHPAPAGRQAMRLYGTHSGTAGYIISKKAAARYLSYNTIADPLDQYMFNPISDVCRSMVNYQLSPGLCVQDGTYDANSTFVSSLHDERRRNRRTGFAKIKREITRPLEQLAQVLRGFYTNIATDRRWTSIPFR